MAPEAAGHLLQWFPSRAPCSVPGCTWTELHSTEPPLLLRPSAHPLPALSKLLLVFGAGCLSHWFWSVFLQGLSSCMFQLVLESSSITFDSSGLQCSWLHSFVPLISQQLCEMNTLVCDYRQCWRFSPNEVSLKLLTWAFRGSGWLRAQSFRDSERTSLAFLVCARHCNLSQDELAFSFYRQLRHKDLTSEDTALCEELAKCLRWSTKPPNPTEIAAGLRPCSPENEVPVPSYLLWIVWFLKKAKLTQSVGWPVPDSQDRQQKLSSNWLCRASSRKEETNTQNTS